MYQTPFIASWLDPTFFIEKREKFTWFQYGCFRLEVSLPGITTADMLFVRYKILQSLRGVRGVVFELF